MSKANQFALLVPCYNAAKYIDSFIENINSLDKSFDEIIFYDDASTDQTYDILVSKGYQVLRGIENMGPGYARNKLIKACSSNWVHFHDIDDGLKPDYLSKVTSIINKNPDTDVVLCNVDWYDANSKALLSRWEYSNAELNQNPLAYIISHPIGGINGLYRKLKCVECGSFNTGIRIWEDADFHVSLASHQALFFVLEEVLSFSLRYPISASSNQDNAWLIRLKLLQHYRDQFTDIKVLQQIGIQAQVAASALVLRNKLSEAKIALSLSEKCGVIVPNNTSKVWGIIKSIFPASIRIYLRLIHLKIAFIKYKAH